MESAQVRDKLYLTYFSTSLWFLLFLLGTELQPICQDNSVISATANVRLWWRGEGWKHPWLTQATQLNHPTGLKSQTSAQSSYKRVNFFILHLGVYYKALCKGKMIQLSNSWSEGFRITAGTWRLPIFTNLCAPFSYCKNTLRRRMNSPAMEVPGSPVMFLHQKVHPTSNQKSVLRNPMVSVAHQIALRNHTSHLV